MKSLDILMCFIGVVALTVISFILGMKVVESNVNMTLPDIKELKRICELDVPRSDVCTVRVVIEPPFRQTQGQTGSSCARSDGKPCEVED